MINALTLLAATLAGLSGGILGTSLAHWLARYPDHRWKMIEALRRAGWTVAVYPDSIAGVAEVLLTNSHHHPPIEAFRAATIEAALSQAINYLERHS